MTHVHLMCIVGSVKQLIAAAVLIAVLAACGGGPGTLKADADELAPVPHPGLAPTEAQAPSGWAGAIEPVIDWDRYRDDEPGDEGSGGDDSGGGGAGSAGGSHSGGGCLSAELANGPVQYTGQCHSGAWTYYTNDARSRGGSSVTVWPNILDGRENGSFVCGHDNSVPLADGRYCSSNAEWARVGGG